MTTIHAKTTDQVLTATILPDIACNNQNSVRLHVAFDSSWNGYAKSAVFYTSKNPTVYEIPLSVDNICFVPAECMTETAHLIITIKGVGSSGVVKSSTELKCKIYKGTPSVIISAPTDNVYHQIIKQLAVANSRFSNLVVGTTVDNELIDARVGNGGEVYESTGDNVRKQSETVENLSVATFGYFDRPTLWSNANLNGNAVSNRITTQEYIAKGTVELYAPSGYRVAVGTYDELGALVTDSGWKIEHYLTDIEIGTRYKVVLSKIDDTTIDVVDGTGVIVREHYETENHETRLKAVENIEERFKETRNVFIGKWINANISNGELVLYDNNPECAAVAEYMPITVNNHVASWESLNADIINLYLYFYDAEKRYISREQFYNISSKAYRIFTVPSGTAYYRVAIYSTVSDDWQDNIPNNFQIELGDVPSAYIGAKTLRNDCIDVEGLYKRLPTYKNIVSATINSIAHRGNPIDAPQCTEPAYIAAKMQGFNIAENDLNISADGKLVMWHDETLSRLGTYLKTTNGNDMYDTNGQQMISANYSVRDLPLATLKQIDFGAYMGNKFAMTQILTFDEWVKLCKTLGLKIYIDKKIKLTYSIVAEMASVIRRYGMVNHTSWVCWDLNEVSLIRNEIQNARIIFLDSPTESNVTSRKALLKYGAVVFNPHTQALTEENAALALDAGFDVECWNVDYANYGFETKSEIFTEIIRVCELGVGGVTLDKYRVEDAILDKWNNN